MQKTVAEDNVLFLLTVVIAFDFFTVSLTVSEIAEEFDELPSAVTWVWRFPYRGCQFY